MGSAMSHVDNAFSFLQQAFPPKPMFDLSQIPDQTGRVALVTGGNTGLGYQTVRALLERNSTVYVAARSKARACAAIARLHEETGKQAHFLELDLADLSSIKRAAEEFLKRESELHVLYNNAGVMSVPIDLVTKDGYDFQWGTNVLGHWYLTELLMPALVTGAQTSTDKHARVVTVASSAAYLGKLNWDTFEDGSARRSLMAGPMRLYLQSKLGNVIVARQLAKRYAHQGIVSISLNPGNIDTELHQHLPQIARALLTNFVLHPAEHGCLTQLYAGTMPDALDYNGEFLIPWARRGRCRKEAYDDEVGQQLWQWLEDQVRMHERA